MARKPVHLTMKRGKATGRQAVWEVIRQLREFSLNDLWHHTMQERDTIRTYLTALRRGGYVEEAGVRPASNGIVGSKHKNAIPMKVFRLVRDIGVEAPRLKRDGTPCEQGLAQEAMWRTMKRLGDFTFRDLAVMSRTEEVPVTESAAKDYVKHLAAAGYLVATREGNAHRLASYRFVKSRNTGPRAPMIQRLKTVFDANLCEIVWQEEVAE
jgi:hypothetical protein